jgi:hypothetical protein
MVIEQFALLVQRPKHLFIAAREEFGLKNKERRFANRCLNGGRFQTAPP